jgi:hypothetical protein
MGKIYRVDTAAFGITGQDINSAHMQDHQILADVAAYYNTVQAIVTCNDYDARRKELAKAQRTYEKACREHVRLPPDPGSHDEEPDTNTYTRDVCADYQPARIIPDGPPAQPADPDHLCTNRTKHEQEFYQGPDTVGPRAAAHPAGITPAGHLHTDLGTHANDEDQRTKPASTGTTPPTNRHLMVNGLEYALDPNGVGLFSIEKSLPVLSREYQQEKYVPRTKPTTNWY